MFKRIRPLFLLALAALVTPCCSIFASDIHQAVVSGDLRKVTSVIDADTGLLNLRDENGRTPLNLSAEIGNKEIARALIDRGADIDLSDSEYRSPMHHAAARGDADMVRLLLERGSTTINDTSRARRGGFEGGWTPLHLAVLNSWPEVVQLLLDHGADLEARDGILRTPLVLAAESRDLRVAEILIERGADINARVIRGYSAILWAARRQFEDYVDLLITKKALVADDELPQAFQMAVVGGMEGLYDYVIELGCNVEEIRQRDAGLIFPAAVGGSVPIVQSLIQHGFVPAQEDSDGWTPLHHAASEGHVGVVECLLASGVDKDLRTKKGETAFNLASLHGRSEVTNCLEQAGADRADPQMPVLEGPYLGQKPPGDAPELFLPGIVSGHYRAHSSITFSPDALEAYWTEMIPPEGRVLSTRVVSGRWTYPVFAELDRDPTFSPDGMRLFFIKTRPFREGEVPGGDPDVKEEYWYLERTGSGWSTPISVGNEVNAIGVHWPCSVDREGNLFFSEFSKEMYCSRYVGGRYEAPVKLTELLGNATLVGSSPFISPNGDYLLFSAGDSLNISFKKKDGMWTDRLNLGGDINASRVNGSPRVTADGKYMFFVSAGQGRPWGIYWVSADFINRLRAEYESSE